MPKPIVGDAQLDSVMVEIRQLLSTLVERVRTDVCQQLVAQVSGTRKSVQAAAHPRHGGRRTKAEVQEMEDRIVQVLLRRPRQRVGPLAEMLHVDREELKPSLAKLVKKGRLSRKGATSAAEYSIKGR
jgi:DNA-binding NtrC family response regulator